jgi:hypothetical protein
VETLKRKIKELETLRGGTLDLIKGSTNAISIKEVSYNLRVKRSVLTTLKKIGLITLKKTLKLQELRSIRNSNIKLLRRLNIINKEDKQLIKSAREQVHLLETSKGGFSLTDRV